MAFRLRKPKQLDLDRVASDSELIQPRRTTLIPKPIELSYCPGCLSSILYLYCSNCNRWFTIPIF